MRKSKRTRQKPLIICFEGIHGVGKTSAFQILKKHYSNSRNNFYGERLAKKPLWPFGSPDKQIAFRSEIHFMQQMLEREKIIKEDLKSGKIEKCFLDRSAISVMVYSKALDLSKKDFKVLDDLYKSVNWTENVMLYFKASPKTILTRIKLRGTLEPERLEWNEDDIKYIKRLEKFYNLYIYKLKNKLKIIEIDTEGKNINEVVDDVIHKIDALIPKIPPAPGQLLLDPYVRSE